MRGGEEIPQGKILLGEGESELGEDGEACSLYGEFLRISHGRKLRFNGSSRWLCAHIPRAARPGRGENFMGAEGVLMNA